MRRGGSFYINFKLSLIKNFTWVTTFNHSKFPFSNAQYLFPWILGVQWQALVIVGESVGQLLLVEHWVPALKLFTLDPHFPYTSVVGGAFSLAYPDLQRKWAKMLFLISTSKENYKII